MSVTTSRCKRHGYRGHMLLYSGLLMAYSGWSGGLPKPHVLFRRSAEQAFFRAMRCGYGGPHGSNGSQVRWLLYLACGSVWPD